MTGHSSIKTESSRRQHPTSVRTRYALLTDIDNTLHNWIDVYVPSFLSMLELVRNVTKQDEDSLLLEFRDVYRRHGSNEYPYVIQELPSVRKLSLTGKELREVLIDPGRLAFAKTRKKLRKLYPGVKETLEWLRGKGLIIVALSDAPKFDTERRLELFGIDHLFDGILCTQDYPPPENSPYIDPQIYVRHNTGQYKTRIPYSKVLSSGRNKRTGEAIAEVIKDFVFDPSHVVVVGDSLAGDVAPARELGATDVWAKYGREAHPENLKLLYSITHRTEQEIQAEKATEGTVCPSHTIESFSELRKIVDELLRHVESIVERP